jgi:hypothetical protein
MHFLHDIPDPVDTTPNKLVSSTIINMMTVVSVRTWLR